MPLLPQGILQGASLGALNVAIFSTYAGALFYGAVLVQDGAFSGGKVITAMLAALIAGFQLALGAPNLQYFIKGKAAGIEKCRWCRLSSHSFT